jgi:L-ribulose-5-phosphate 3-epimerase
MPPIISCLTNSYGRFGPQAAIEMIGSTGLEYIELPIRTAEVESFFKETPLVTSASTLDDLNQVDRLLDQHAVKVSSCNISSGNPLDAEVLDITKRKLDLASHFGVSLVVAGAGEAETPEDLQRLYDHLRQIGDHAAKKNIIYCFETHRGICQHHRGMLETMHELDHPNLRLNFDTGNILYYNENIVVEVALAKVCHLVKHVHLKDSRGEFGKWYFPSLGNGGAVDFMRVYELMRDCGFNGPYSLEIEGIAGEDEPTRQQYHQRIADSVEHLRNCGYFD